MPRDPVVMDSSDVGRGFLSESSVRGVFELASSIEKDKQTQPDRYSSLNQMNLLGVLDSPSRGLVEVNCSPQMAIAMNFSKNKAPSVVDAADSGNASEEDEPIPTEDDCDGTFTGGKSSNTSLWHRMKWTDDNIRFLIQAVAFVGDDGVMDRLERLKRRSGCLQRKGKWKSVSKIMNSKGCNVSPQQCEDKFNDLNKRYKKLNDIVGRGISWKVVEDPVLMDSVPHLSAKTKEELKKILSSKHLFYKEMRAYHAGRTLQNCHSSDVEGCSIDTGQGFRENIALQENFHESYSNDGSEGKDSDDDSDDDEGDDGENTHCNTERDGFLGAYQENFIVYDNFKAQMAVFFQDPSRSLPEQREWIKRQRLCLHEQWVRLQARSFQLEKQRCKWLRYCSEKDAEMEKHRMKNEELRLENEHSLLKLRQKEVKMNLRLPEFCVEPNFPGRSS